MLWLAQLVPLGFRGFVFPDGLDDGHFQWHTALGHRVFPFSLLASFRSPSVLGSLASCTRCGWWGRWRGSKVCQYDSACTVDALSLFGERVSEPICYGLKKSVIGTCITGLWSTSVVVGKTRDLTCGLMVFWSKIRGRLLDGVSKISRRFYFL